MAEIHTCEEYVLNLLEDTQNEIARLQEVIAGLNYKIGEKDEELENFYKLKDLIRRISKRYHYEDSYDSISISSLYEHLDSDYDILLELIPDMSVINEDK